MTRWRAAGPSPTVRGINRRMSALGQADVNGAAAGEKKRPWRRAGRGTSSIDFAGKSAVRRARPGDAPE